LLEIRNKKKITLGQIYNIKYYQTLFGLYENVALRGFYLHHRKGKNHNENQTCKQQLSIIQKLRKEFPNNSAITAPRRNMVEKCKDLHGQ